MLSISEPVVNPVTNYYNSKKGKGKREKGRMVMRKSAIQAKPSNQEFHFPPTHLITITTTHSCQPSNYNTINQVTTTETKQASQDSNLDPQEAIPPKGERQADISCELKKGEGNE